MKKYGKLLIAFMWLGLTMIMIVGATFAWFSENRNVTADGMQVQAQVAKNLLISVSEADDFDVSASIEGETSTLKPASTTAPSDTSFYYVTNPQTIVYSSGDKQNDTVFAATTTSNLGTYVAKYSFDIKVEGAADDTLEDLYVYSIDVTPQSEHISSSLRVAVVCEEAAYIYAPVSGYTTGYLGINSTSGTTGNITIKTPGSASNAGVLADTVDTTGVTVVVYVWYEGQDENCTSFNSISVEEVEIVINFRASDPA